MPRQGSMRIVVEDGKGQLKVELLRERRLISQGGQLLPTNVRWRRLPWMEGKLPLPPSARVWVVESESKSESMST